MSYKRNLLMTALASTLSLTSLSAAEISTPTEKKIMCHGGTYDAFPVTQPRTNNYSQLALKGVQLQSPIPLWVFQENSALKKVALVESSVNFSAFTNNLGQGCPNLEELNLTGMTGISLKDFIETVASSGLLDKILKEECKLKFTCPDDGKTAAVFRADSDPGLYSTSTVKQLIKMFQAQKAKEAQSTWWGAAANWLTGPTPALPAQSAKPATEVKEDKK